MDIIKSLLNIVWRVLSKTIVVMIPLTFIMIGLNILGLDLSYRFILGFGFIISGLYEFIDWK